MEVTTVTREPLSLIGLEVRASNERADLLGALWGRFLEEGIPGRIPDRRGDAIVAVYCEYDGDHTQPYTFFLGCRVDADALAPDGLVRRDVPGGTFARFEAVGEQPQALIQTWMAIWQTPIERRYEADYEIHDPTDATRVEILLGV